MLNYSYRAKNQADILLSVTLNVTSFKVVELKSLHTYRDTLILIFNVNVLILCFYPLRN